MTYFTKKYIQTFIYLQLLMYKYDTILLYNCNINVVYCLLSINISKYIIEKEWTKHKLFSFENCQIEFWQQKLLKHNSDLNLGFSTT